MKEITEGESRLLVPDVSMPEKGEVFYNPTQAVSRDLSILFYQSKDMDVLDGMAASGARSIRLAKNGVKVTANDYSKGAVKLIEKNAKLNGLEFPILNMDVRKAMLSQRWGAIDIDPFGSPAPFVHYALESAVKFIGLAATDTAALCGTYPRVARRRYDFVSKRTPNYPEIGVRGLAGFVVREAAKLEIAARPVFAHSFQHYYRLYFALSGGARRVDLLLDELGNHNGVGPLFLGNLWDKETVNDMIKLSKNFEFGHKKSLAHLLLIKDELKYPQPYFDLHALCREKKLKCPPLSSVLEKNHAVRTHFTPLGFRCEGQPKL